MATGWVKSLQCKSKAFEDVINPISKKQHLFLTNSSCRKTSRSIKSDVVEDNIKITPRQTPNVKPHHRRRHSHHHRREKPLPPPTPEPFQTPTYCSRSLSSVDHLFPALTELPEGNPSRNVVDIIFHTSWANKSFPGRVDMIFKVQNGSRTVARFEEYRESVKARASLSGSNAWEEHGRCVADGNEMMRFHCLGGPTAGCGFYDGAWPFHSGKGTAICTFSGSGGAHESAGGGRGRRAMLVCRVIAGRVYKQSNVESSTSLRVGFDSMSGDTDQLLVFDSRAVLPCFLIIYKL